MGTGRNLPFYDRSRISRLVGVDPALQMHRLAQKRSREAGIAVELMGLSAEQLPTADASFDTVVCPTRCAASPMRCRPCARCAGCWCRVASCCFASMVVPPMKACAVGKTVCSPSGGRWPEAVSWGGIFRLCWTLPGFRPPRNPPICQAHAR